MIAFLLLLLVLFAIWRWISRPIEPIHFEPPPVLNVTIQIKGDVHVHSDRPRALRHHD